jgi:hypothetical protein
LAELWPTPDTSWLVALPSALHPDGASGSRPASFDDFPHPSNKTQKPVTASVLAVLIELLYGEWSDPSSVVRFLDFHSGDLARFLIRVHSR